MKKKSLILSIGVVAGVALAAQLSTVIGSDYDFDENAHDDDGTEEAAHDHAANGGHDDGYSDNNYADDYGQPCELIVDYEQGQAVLYAYAAEGAVGEWQLTFSQYGSGGSSSISQGGEIYPDGPGPIALSEISVPSDGSFEATLTTHTAAGANSCTVSS